MTASLLSLIPGLGTYYLSRDVRRSLTYFAGWFSLLALHELVRGSFLGWILTTIFFSFHQYLLYRVYLDGLRKNHTPLPDPIQGTLISVLMAVILFGLYLHFSVFTMSGLFAFRA